MSKLLQLQEKIYLNSYNNFYIKYDENLDPVDIIFTDDDISNEIIKIEVIDNYDDFVYDIETEDGTFQAGFGNIIVSNTDSVFIHYKNNKDCNIQDKEEKSLVLKHCFELGDEIAEQASKLFKEPILLEFEKVYFPFLSFGKKMYSGICYEPPNTLKSKLDNKGIVLSRRDNPNITKIIYQGILDIIMSEGKKGIPRAINFLHESIKSILEGERDISDFIVSKTYKTNYKSENIPHKILAEKIAKRDPGNAPAANERIPYVFIDNKSTKQFEKVEHPDYVIKHNIKLDGLYYVEQIKNPISQILKTFMEDSEINKIFLNHKTDYILKKNGQKKITDFYKIKNKIEKKY